MSNIKIYVTALKERQGKCGSAMVIVEMENTGFRDAMTSKAISEALHIAGNGELHFEESGNRVAHYQETVMELDSEETENA